MKLISLTNSSLHAMVDDKEYLARKYNEKALELYGSTAKLNKIEG